MVIAEGDDDKPIPPARGDAVVIAEGDKDAPTTPARRDAVVIAEGGKDAPTTPARRYAVVIAEGDKDATTVTVGIGFASECAKLAAASDRAGLETMFFMFGQRDPAHVTHLVLVDHNATAFTCTLSDAGSVALVEFKTTHTDLSLLGWVHSHHGLEQQPSAADLKQQVELHNQDVNSVMIILKPECAAQAWRNPRAEHAYLRANGVDSNKSATDALTRVDLHEAASEPIAVVIIGRLLDLGFGACAHGGPWIMFPGAC